MTENNPKRILVAPLDWGLGHTTRCVPLIRHLQQLGCKVIVAGNPTQLSFIENTFSNIEIIHLEGYNVTYSSGQGLGSGVLLRQVPGIYKKIKEEHQWLNKAVRDLNIDGIISDNRYGLYHNKIPSVIMTHQLQVQTGMGVGMNRLVQKLHYSFLEKFRQVWVPDLSGDRNVGGDLSHSVHNPKTTRYIGLLSQFEPGTPAAGTEPYLLVLLSGPEPQRTVLANSIWQQLAGYNGKVVFVAGSTTAPMPAPHNNSITYFPRSGGAELAQLITGASLVVCRSGYSTIMDLLLLGKKAILIPTPGQTEQEYLAQHLFKSSVYMTSPQADLNLSQLLNNAATFPFSLPDYTNNYQDFVPVLDEWVGAL